MGVRVVLTSVHSWPDVRRGGERYAHELSAALSRAGHDVRLVSTGRRTGTGSELGVPVRRMPVRRAPGHYPEPWQDLAIERAFGAQAAAHLVPRLGRFDVWHATSTGDAAAAAVTGRLRPGLASVFTDHGFPVRRSRDSRPDRREHLLVTRQIGAYVCVSRAAADCLQRDYGRRAAVVPPGVRFAAHHPARRHPRPVLLYAGSLVESRKGLPLLFEAVALLRRDAPDLELWLFGQGDAEPLLAAAPAEARAAVTRCEVLTDDDLRQAYAAAWVTVLPSHAESFGMVVVESLASGTPAVVLREGGGPPEIVDSDDVGRRTDATAESLAEACAEALELARQPGTVEACRARAEQFDWDGAVVPALTRVYEAARG